MEALRSSTGSGRYVANEWDVTLGTNQAWIGGGLPLIWAHNASYTALTAYSDADQRNVLQALAQTFTVCAADLGGDQCGSDTGITRVGQVKTHLGTAPWSCTAKPVIVGFSAGALNGLAYIRANPTLVAGFVGVLPALDLNDLHANNRGGFSTAIVNAAYGGSYDDATHGPTHSPVQFAASLPADLPITLLTSSDDPVCVPATADAFVAARPQTVRTSLGALGHAPESLAGQAAVIAAAAVAML